jgi:plasmid stabilization system protein ParE
MKVQIAPTVNSDLLRIMEYYDSEAGADIASEFYTEFRRGAKAAGQRPYSFPLSGSFRRVNLHTYPYHFLFGISGDDIVRILIVRHNHRHPDFGLRT